MKKTKKVFKFWLGYNADKMEKWLESQEEKGWNLVSISSTGTGFTFKKGVPRKIAYCFDFQNQAKKDYLQLFEDDNWTLISKGSGWYYWQQAYTNKKPEIYTDIESLTGRNKRQMLFAAIILFAQFTGVRVSLQLFSKKITFLNSCLLGFISIIVLSLVFIIIRFFMANRQLKRQDTL